MPRWVPAAGHLTTIGPALHRATCLLPQVYKPAGPMLLLMKVTALVMLLVAVAAAIASCQNIIDSWSTFTFFS